MTRTEELLDRLLGRIVEAFGPLEYHSARLEVEGYDHFAVILDEALVFRLAKTPQPPGYFQREVRLLRALQGKTVVGIPAPTHLSDDANIMGYPYLRGQKLTAKIVNRLEQEAVASLAAGLCSFLQAMHALPAADLGFKPNGESEELEWLRKGLADHLQGRLRPEEVRQAERYVDEFACTMQAAPGQVLVHGDLGLDHVLRETHSGATSVIDFSDAHTGDPAFDLVGLCASPGLLDKVATHYAAPGERQDLIDRANFYAKRLALHHMIDSQLGYPASFDQGYQLFRREIASS